MGDESPKVKAAVVQAASVLFDREASVEKAVHLIAEAAFAPIALLSAMNLGVSQGLGLGVSALNFRVPSISFPRLRPLSSSPMKRSS